MNLETKMVLLTPMIKEILYIVTPKITVINLKVTRRKKDSYAEIRMRYYVEGQEAIFGRYSTFCDFSKDQIVDTYGRIYPEPLVDEFDKLIVAFLRYIKSRGISLITDKYISLVPHTNECIISNATSSKVTHISVTRTTYKILIGLLNSRLIYSP